MLDALNTRIGSDTFHVPYDVEAGFHQEGAIMVAVVKNGETLATPSKGVAGEKFLGISTGYGSPAGGERINYVDEAIPSGTDPATGNPVPNTIYVPGLKLVRAVLKIDGTAATAATAGAAPAAGEYQFEGNTVVFNSADAGKKVTGYVVSPQLGDPVWAGDIGNGGFVALIGNGTISTDQFDPDGAYVAADDAVPVPLYTAPNGKVSTATTGTLLPRCETLVPPELNDGFIKFRLL